MPGKTTPPPVLLRQLLGPALRFAAPGVTVLFALAVAGLLSPLVTVVSMAAIVVATVALTHAQATEWGHLAFWVGSRANGGDGAEPPTGFHYVTLGDAIIRGIVALQQRDRQRAEAAETAAAYLTSVVENLPEPLLVVSSTRQVTSANASAREAFGREVVDRDLTGVFRDPDLLQAVDDALFERHPRKELTLRLPGSVARTFRVVVEPLPEGIADTPHALATLQDITDLVRVEQMRADFVANASHELRTPLTSVLGFIDTLRGPAHDDEEARDRFLAIMAQQAERMRHLIEDLLSLSRIELREHTKPTARVALRALVEDVADGLLPQAEQKKMTISFDVPDALPSVIGDADELTQVIQNLLSNAIKYGRPGTAVEVKASLAERGPLAMPRATASNCIAVAVIDHGDGIAKEHLPRLTERFYRVDNARSRQLGGTGLGLAIVKHIVNRHRGALTIESTLGKGSTFTVWLPKA